MDADSRGYTLDISEHLFRLTTESLRIHSNETKAYQTLENLVDARTGDLSRINDHDTSSSPQSWPTSTMFRAPR